MTAPDPRVPPTAVAPRFALLFAAQFAATGVALPFFPAFLAERGLDPMQVGAVLAAGSAVRLLAGPAAGWLADAVGDARLVLVVASALAAATAAGFGLAAGFALLLAVQVVHGAAMGPLVPLGDSLAVTASRGGAAFDYGRVRAAGSVAFILTAAAAGQLASALGMEAIVWLYAAGLVAATLSAAALPVRPRGQQGAVARAGGAAGFGGPLRIAAFRRLLILSALIQSGHAIYYGFATIHWQAAGHSPAVIGLLWAEGVVAEVVLFLFGRRAAERLGAGGLCAIAAGAGLLRWGITAETTWLPALAAAQLLHAATFGAQHLAAMRVLGQAIPAHQAATAQTVHAALGVGLPMGVLTMLGGSLYGVLGGVAFWLPAVLSAAALPLAFGLQRQAVQASAGRAARDESP